MAVVELYHPSDPRFVIVEGELPDEITVEDLGAGLYGTVMIRTELYLALGKNPWDAAPEDVDFVYAQPAGFGTPWVRSLGRTTTTEEGAVEGEPKFCGECGKRLPDHHDGCTRPGTVEVERPPTEIREQAEVVPGASVPGEIEERLRDDGEATDETEVTGL
jgi:hypothetical protein